jgi:hypothetical protein
MTMGGRTIYVPQGGGTSSPGPERAGGAGHSSEYNRKKRAREAEEARRRRMARHAMTALLEQVMGGGGSAGNRGGGGLGGPIMSPFPGYSYKASGSTPDYHREMPYGGTPGVYAIRNDEIAGPRRDTMAGLWDRVRSSHRGPVWRRRW